MNNSGQVTNQQSGSAASDSGRAPDGAEEQDIQQTINGLSSILAQLDQLTKSLKVWSGSTLDLFLLEMKVNVSAVRQILLCTVVLLYCRYCSYSVCALPLGWWLIS